MNPSRIVFLVLVILALPLSFAFAAGAGGVTWSDQRYVSGLSNTTVTSSEIGGFGYAVNREGLRTGGFGYAIYSPSGTQALAGGVGGVILGQEGHTGPLTFAANLWTGLGGISATFSGTRTGHAIVFGEANLELGVAVTPWMQLSMYAGMQGMADVDPQSGVGTQLASYWPVVGMRLSWGSFNARW